MELCVLHVEGLIEQHEAVTTTLCLLNKNSLCLDSEDVGAMKNAVTLLKSFEAATREMSGDQYLTISKLIPLARSLQQLTAALQKCQCRNSSRTSRACVLFIRSHVETAHRPIRECCINPPCGISTSLCAKKL